MANLARLGNVVAPLVTSPDGLFSQSIYHPFQLMASASEQIAVDTYTDSGARVHRDRPGDRWPYRVADLGLFQRLSPPRPPPPPPRGAGCRCRWSTAIRAEWSGPGSGCSTPGRPG